MQTLESFKATHQKLVHITLCFQNKLSPKLTYPYLNTMPATQTDRQTDIHTHVDTHTPEQCNVL
jgi:hypothetical protein